MTACEVLVLLHVGRNTTKPDKPRKEVELLPPGRSLKLHVMAQSFDYLYDVGRSFEHGGNYMGGDDIVLHIVRNHLFKYHSEIKARLVAFKEAREKWKAAIAGLKKGDPWIPNPPQPVFPGLEDYVAERINDRMKVLAPYTSHGFRIEPEPTAEEVEAELKAEAEEPEDPDDLKISDPQ